MNAATPLRNISDERLEYIDLMRGIEDFLHMEADLLDARAFDEWLALFSEDVRYWMPMRKNLSYRRQDKDITDLDDVAWINDDKTTLSKRIQQIQTGVHWAEEPLSRVSHIVSNIRLQGEAQGVSEGDELRVNCHFLVHRNRLERETDFIVGRREDHLRRTGNSYLICRRNIIIDQSVLLAKNLTFFL